MANVMNLAQPGREQMATRAMQDEALRQRAMQPPSTAGIGAQTAQAPESPLQQQGMNPQPPTMSGGAMGAPSDGAVAGMKQQKAEAEKLGDALVWRLKKITERGE